MTLPTNDVGDCIVNRAGICVRSGHQHTAAVLAHQHVYTGNESSKRMYCACGKWILTEEEG